jgi:hypothetical protein
MEENHREENHMEEIHMGRIQMTVLRRVHERVRQTPLERGFAIVRFLAKHGATTVQLAVEFKISKRLVFTTMAALKRAGVPVLQHKEPGRGPLWWDIDLGAFLAQFARDHIRPHKV